MKIYCPFVIDESGYQELLSNIDSANSNDTLIITSCSGGFVDYALDLAKRIREKGLKTHVEFICASAANLLYFAGTERTATDYARFLLHQARYDYYYNVNVNSNILETELENLRQTDILISELLANWTGVDKDVFLMIMDMNGGEGKWISVDELISLGIQLTKIVEKEQINLIAARFIDKLNKINNLQQVKVEEKVEEKSKSPLSKEIEQQLLLLQEEGKKFDEWAYHVDKAARAVPDIVDSINDLTDKLNQLEEQVTNKLKQLEELVDELKRKDLKKQQVNSVNRLVEGQTITSFSKFVDQIERLK